MTENTFITHANVPRQLPAGPDGKVRLDLACGDNKAAGHLGIDKYKMASTDYEFDLLEFPWPLDDASVDSLHCSHFFEHIPGLQRPAFMDECWRVLKPNGQLSVITPHWTSQRSVQDFTHAWPPVAEASFLYFNRQWRESNRLTHGLYDIKCDFGFTYGYSIDGEVSTRNNEYQAFAVKHYNNAAMDLMVTLTKIQPTGEDSAK